MRLAEGSRSALKRFAPALPPDKSVAKKAMKDTINNVSSANPILRLMVSGIRVLPDLLIAVSGVVSLFIVNECG